MNDLFSALRISRLETVLQAYKKARIDLGNAIDGGAGSGSTGRQILKHLDTEAKVFAFEPFPGNHRFFANVDKRIILKKKALSRKSGTSAFHVSSVVSKDSDWGSKGMTGYSSVGMLTSNPVDGRLNIEVECVRADVELADQNIGFVKLDLQGGELSALVGMEGLLSNIQVMFVEFTNQKHLLNLIEQSGFLVFDTEYLFMGSPTQEAETIFDVSEANVGLSTGSAAWKGFKKYPWKSFGSEFDEYRERFRMVQTDVICINRRYLEKFVMAMGHLEKA